MAPSALAEFWRERRSCYGIARARYIKVRDLRQSRRLEILNGSKPYRPAGIGRAPKRRHSRCAVRSFLSPHPSPLPWGEGAPASPRRTIQTRRLSTARCALFPPPEGAGQGEGKRRELPSRVSDHSRKRLTGPV